MFSWLFSILIILLGITVCKGCRYFFDKKISNVAHHNLFFDTNFDDHAVDIYDKPKWPTDPLFYANFTSKSNSKTAPDGCENGFFLIPLATNLEDNEEFREKYFNIIIDRLEKLTNQKLKNNIIQL